MLHLLIPAAGESRRFAEAGYAGPKSLLRLNWKGREATMLEHVIESVGQPLTTIIGVRPEDKPVFAEALPMYSFKTIEGSTGQAHTVRLMSNYIGSTDELLIVNSDNAFDAAAPMQMVMRAKKVQASCAALVFIATEDKYGFVDGYPFFEAGAEKVAISNFALAGAFYFRSAAVFKAAYAALENEQKNATGERYLSSVFKYLVEPKLAVRINRRQLHEWGTPDSIEQDESCVLIK